MDIRNLRTSIEHAIIHGYDRDDTAATIAKDVYLLTLAAMWNHTKDEYLRIEHLTDAEVRMLLEWKHFTAADYERRGTLAQVADMREVFPGLSLTAAAYIVR
jgi:hypothetical protein